MAASVVYSNFCGMIVSETRGGVSHDYIPDTLGSTMALIDENGDVSDTFEYWPYGEVMERTGTTPTPFTFVGTLGYFRDILDKMFYVRARYLRPDLARWQTVDPLWPVERAYGYANQDPVLETDILGLGPACICRGTPSITGVPKSDPHYPCYLKVCAWFSTVCKPHFVGSQCSGYVSCYGINQAYPPCPPSNPCYAKCHTSGGNPTPGGGQVLPDWCCIECQIRVCCHVECPLENNLLILVQRKFQNCRTRGRP